MAKAEQERSKVVLQEVKAQQESVAKEPLFSKNFKPFTFDNGAMVSSLQELLEVLSTMDDQIFKFHFKGEKNDLPAWIEGIDGEIGQRTKALGTRQELIKALTEEKKKNRMYASAAETPKAGAPAAAMPKESTPKSAAAKTESSDQDIDQLVVKIERLIGSGDRARAASLYLTIRQKYKELPAAAKPAYYKKIIEIVQKLK
jgi:hypothetical protein